MQRKSKSKEKDKSLLERSYRVTEESQVKSSRGSNNQRLYHLEEKLREFGGL